MSENVVVVKRGMGFFGTLTLLLVFLKALGLVNFSWWWVFAPIWLPPAFLIFILISIGISILTVATIVLIYEKIFE